MTISKLGGPEVLVWTEVPDPEPAAGEVLIDVVASAVNHADLLQRRGLYPPPPDASTYPGLECSGRIAKLGSGVTGWRVGESVCALLSGGGYAQRVAVPAGQVLPVPPRVNLADAAALPEAACTVWSNVVGIGHLRATETLLVHGGSGGIGTFAIQLGRELGARVITTARSAKHSALTALGAHRVIDYTTEDFVAAARHASDGRGVDVILDIIGAEYLGRNVETLATGGRLLVIGLQGGRLAELNLDALLAKRALIAAASLRPRPAAEKAAIVADVRARVWPVIERGRVRPVISERLPMTEAARAHRLVETGDHVGKVLLLAP